MKEPRIQFNFKIHTGALLRRIMAAGLSLLLLAQLGAAPVQALETVPTTQETVGQEEAAAAQTTQPVTLPQETETVPPTQPTDETSQPTLQPSETAEPETEASEPPQEQTAPTQPEKTKPYVEYTVPEGATLAAIAGHYGVSQQALLELNGITEITPGQTLRVPAKPEWGIEPYVPPQRHTVEPGQTLTQIAEMYGVPLESLRRWNNVPTGGSVGRGVELLIPVIQKPGPFGKIVGYSPSCASRPGEPLQVPLYYQNDYPSEMYGIGTVAKDGCGITSLAMVATALTGHPYKPDELARYFGGCAESNMARLEYGSEVLQLPFWKSPNWNETYAALKEGKLVIALMAGNSLFTTTQHFIVLTGLTEDGKVLVNDPFKPNYEKWDLKEGFANGFSVNQMLLGYSGAWIYDPAQMPEQAPIYAEPELDRSFTRYPVIELSDADRDLLARVIWAEARGESLEGQQAVAEVVFNRMISAQFSDTLRDVVYGDKQFRSVPHLKDAEPWQAQYQAIDRALYGKSILPAAVLYFSRTPTNDSIWGEIGHHIFCY